MIEIIQHRSEGKNQEAKETKHRSAKEMSDCEMRPGSEYGTPGTGEMKCLWCINLEEEAPIKLLWGWDRMHPKTAAAYRN